MTNGLKSAITLQKTGYSISGVSALTLWGNDFGTIEMKPFKLEKLGLHAIKEAINDGGFGCQSIDCAIIDIAENFEGKLNYVKTLTIKFNPITDEQMDALAEHYNNEF